MGQGPPTPRLLPYLLPQDTGRHSGQGKHRKKRGAPFGVRVTQWVSTHTPPVSQKRNKQGLLGSP